MDCLEAKGYIFTDPDYATLRLTSQAGNVLFHGETVAMRSRVERQSASLEKRKREIPAVAGQGLLSALKAERTRLARQEGVPPYIIFSNAVLADMAGRSPRTMEEFLEVSGVGQIKAERYGECFLAVIAEYFNTAGNFTIN